MTGHLRDESRPPVATSPRVHFTADNYENDDGHFAHCRCGEAIGPLPDIEALLDAVMAHAYWAGREDEACGSGGES